VLKLRLTKRGFFYKRKKVCGELKGSLGGKRREAVAGKVR